MPLWNQFHALFNFESYLICKSFIGLFLGFESHFAFGWRRRIYDRVCFTWNYTFSFGILSENGFTQCFGIEVSIKTCLVYFLTLRMKKFRCKKMNNYFLLVTFHSVSTGKMYSTGLFATGPTFLVTSSFGWVCNFLWAKVLGPLVTVVKF